MALIELDEDMEKFEKEEADRLSELRKPIEKPRVKGMVQEWEYQVSKKGNPMIQWTLRVVEEPEFPDKTLRHWTPTSGKGKFQLSLFAKACKKSISGKQFDPDAFVGSQVWVDLHVEQMEAPEGEAPRFVNRIDAISAI